MLIEKVLISGFKNVQSPKTYEFGCKVLIGGDNRVGKSSLGESIAFCFFGTSLRGETKRVEDIINTASNEAVVEVVFVDDNGNRHVMERRKNRKDQTITFDGVAVKQEQVNQIVGECDLFLSCFNPEYFNGVLDDKERRALITKYTPIVDMYALFEEFAPTSLISKYSININKASESARFNKFLKSIQDESIQPARTEIGVLNQQVMQLNIPTRKPVDQDKEKQLNDAIMSLNAVKLSAASIAEKQDKYAKAILDIEAKKKELDEFSEKVKQIQLPIDPKTNDPKYSQCIEAISASNQIIKLAQSISQANVGICSLCGQSISDSYKNELQNRANEAVVTKKQNEEYVNSQSEQYAKYLDSWNKIQEHLKKLGNELIMLEKMAESHKSDMNGQTTSDLSDVDEKIAKLSAELSEVAAKNQEAIMHNLGVDNAETQIKNNKKRIEELNKHIQDSLVSLEEVEKICAALKPSTGIFRKAIEIKSQDLLTHLNHCSILLERQLKNGDTEECFEIYYNERPYRRSSYSERVLCNLEIAKFLRAKSQKNIPLFLDNSESISNVPKEYLTCDQIFMCRVIAGQELIVRNS